MKLYEVYCDGAYSPARDVSGSGIVIVKDNKVVMKFGKKFQGGTNNTAELCAVILSMRSFKAPVDKITIYSDSMYIIGTITKNWKRNKNLKLWQQFDVCYDSLTKLCPDISFVWVKGHNDNPYNNLADRLAVEATQSI